MEFKERQRKIVSSILDSCSAAPEEEEDDGSEQL
jgi:hypothetical protein